MSDDLHDTLAQAIADPGAFTPRGDNYRESIPRWGARAVPLALAERGHTVVPEQLLTDVLNYLGDRSAGCGYIWDALEEILAKKGEA